MNNFKRVGKAIEILGELYEDDPQYFVDCFFDMYYQMKKKKTVDDKCKHDTDKVKAVWAALNLFKHLVVDKNEHPDKAFVIAYRTHKVEKELLSSVVSSFKAYRGAKKTKFKIFL